MAKITQNADAPDGVVTYGFADGDFQLGGAKRSFETDNRSIISDAAVHPWLIVEEDSTPDAPAPVAPVVINTPNTEDDA